MAAKHIYTFIDPCKESDLQLACATLDSGGVIAYSTGTNWGFGCKINNKKAIEKLIQIKFEPHESQSPFSLMCSDISMAAKYVNISNSHYRILKKIFPGPYTVLLERSKMLPKYIGDKRRVVGLRIPNAPLILAIIDKLQEPIFNSTIPDLKNELGAVEPPIFGYQVADAYSHQIELILDLGNEVSGQPTTVIDATEENFSLIRLGAGDISFLQ